MELLSQLNFIPCRNYQINTEWSLPAVSCTIYEVDEFKLLQGGFELSSDKYYANVGICGYNL